MAHNAKIFIHWPFTEKVCCPLRSWLWSHAVRLRVHYKIEIRVSWWRHMGEISAFYRQNKEGHDLQDVHTLSWRNLSLYVWWNAHLTQAAGTPPGAKATAGLQVLAVVAAVGEDDGTWNIFLFMKKQTMLWVYEMGLGRASDSTMISRAPSNGSGLSLGAGDTVLALPEHILAFRCVRQVSRKTSESALKTLLFCFVPSELFILHYWFLNRLYIYMINDQKILKGRLCRTSLPSILTLMT